MKWIKEDRPTTSKESNPHKKPFKKLDSFDIDVISRKIKEMMESGEMITTKKLQASLRMDHRLEVPKTTLWRVIRFKGFTFKKTNGIRKILCERHDLQVARCAYLRSI